MEGLKVTIKVTSKFNAAASYVDEFYTQATDPQMAKYEYHKFTRENHPDVVGADGSHTLHINGGYPQVQRLVSIEPVDEIPEDGTRPLSFI